MESVKTAAIEEDMNEEASKIPDEEQNNVKKIPYKQKLLFTFWTLITVVGVGAAVNVRGPALLDFQASTGTTVDVITAAVFVPIALGWAGGAIVGGILYDRFQKYLVISTFVSLAGIFTVIVPWCRNVYAVALMMLFGGATISAAYTGIATMTLNVWEADSPPYMQIQDFAFSAGGVIGILILEAFTISKADVYMPSAKCQTLQRSHIQNSTKVNLINITSDESGSNYTAKIDEIVKDSNSLSDNRESYFEYVYLVIGVYLFLTAVPFLVYHTKKIDLLVSTDKKDDDQSEVVVVSAAKKRLRQGLLICSFALYFFFIGGSETFTGLMTTFTVKYLCWDRSLGNLIPSLVWAVTATTQLLAIIVTKFLKPIQIMTASMVFGAIDLAVLCFAVETTSIVMWVCAGLCGVAIAPIFPNGMSWLNTHVLVTGTLMSMIQISGGLGAVAVPSLVGWLFDNVSGIWYIYTVFLCWLACVFVLFSGMIIGNKYGERFDTKKTACEVTVKDDGAAEVEPLSVTAALSKEI